MGNWVLENRLLNNRSISKDKNTPMDLFLYDIMECGLWTCRVTFNGTHNLPLSSLF